VDSISLLKIVIAPPSALPGTHWARNACCAFIPLYSSDNPSFGPTVHHRKLALYVPTVFYFTLKDTSAGFPSGPISVTYSPANLYSVAGLIADRDPLARILNYRGKQKKI
jgi:hypothetical protein